MSTIFFDHSLKKAMDYINRSDDNQLNSPGFSETVFNQCKISIPVLNLERVKTEIKSEEINYRNAPPGINFSLSGSTVVEVALYTIPVSGNEELFKLVVGRYIDRQRTYYEHGNLYYKEYSNFNISGNSELINAIKNRVKEFTDSVIQALEQLSNEIEEFHQTKLKPSIESHLNSEINRRRQRRDSESQLNPFA